MAFDWIAFLEANHIKYVTTGPNVSRGNIAVHCPLCGAADKSEHMSISLNGKGWRCFRNRDEHKGKNPTRLVAALLNVSIDRARSIVGDAVFIPDDFMGAVMGKLTPHVGVSKPHTLKLPIEFKPLHTDKPSVKAFKNYLTGPTRQFTPNQVRRFTKDYDMYYATRGPMKGRVVFTVYFNHKLVTWTGRTIYPQVDLRYKTLSADPEVEQYPALGPINDYLLWYDDLNNRKHDSDTLVLCEGPFDALKVSVLGAKHGIDATCFFTASPSTRQIDLLHDLMPQYSRRFLLLDRGTLSTALRVQGGLHALKVPYLTLPANVKDPGVLDERGLLKILP